MYRQSVEIIPNLDDGQTNWNHYRLPLPYRARSTMDHLSVVRWLGPALDGQTDCFKTNRIRLSVHNRPLSAGSARNDVGKRLNIVSALCKRVKDQLIHKDLSFVIRTLKSEDITLLFTTTTLLCTSYPYGVEPDGSVDDAS